MKLNDEGLFLFSKKHGEKFLVLSIFSKKNGLIKALSRITKSKSYALLNLDKICFELSYKNKDSFGFIKYDQMTSNKIDDNLFLTIKASASELCLKLIPSWEENEFIFESLINLSNIANYDKVSLIEKYVRWELSLLNALGYGLNLKECSVTGKSDVFYISPKSGNSVCYEVGKEYDKKLFKVPKFLKNMNYHPKLDELERCLNISGYFLLKIYEFNNKFIFRDQLINIISKL
jgi:DNA repair protein RecO (recombination protein O)